MYFKSPTFLTAENGTKVFAILNFILACLSSLATIGGLIFFTTKVIMRYYAHDLYKEDMMMMMMPNIFIGIGILIMMVFSLIALMFAAFLFNGVFKKKPEHIQVYFVYGVGVDILCFLATFGLLHWDNNFLAFLVLISVCFIYALILAMIKKTYEEFQSLNQQYNHKQLAEKC